MEAYREAIRLAPDHAPARIKLGDALQLCGRLEEAVIAYQDAIRLQPDQAGAYNNLGIALQDLGRHDEAIACYRRAVELQPADAEAQGNLGVALAETGKLDEALEACRRAVQLDPNYAAAQNNLGNRYKDMGRMGPAIECYRRAVALQPDAPDIHSNLAYTVGFDASYDGAALLAEARDWDQRMASRSGNSLVHMAMTAPQNAGLRVGFVSPDFCEHVVGRSLLPLLQEHDRERLEIFCYANVVRPDGLTEALRSQAAHWRNIFGVGNPEAAEMIRADGIDILVDLALHTARNRLPLFALKPAPVQVSYLGYCGTTGVETIDYRLSDPYIDPPDSDLKCYSEETICLPHSYWCYQPPLETGGLTITRGRSWFCDLWLSQ